jgi:hypothetical protein
MTNYASVRKSDCIACGVRLSEKSPSGKILWKPSHIDDKGIYCEACYKKKMDAKQRKSAEK